MKKKIALIALSIMAIFSFGACQKDGITTTDGKKVSEAVVKSFDKKFPEAQNVIWENKAPYWVAHFDLPKTKAAPAEQRSNSSWFDNQGNWQMTEHDIEYATLPEAVKHTFETSKYAKWEIDDVETLERDGIVALYIIEVEKKDASGKEVELELYFTAEGLLTKVVPATEDHTELIPEDLPEALKTIIAKTFPEFKLLEAEVEDGKFEVEILFNGKDYELKYTTDFEWISTKYEIEPKNMEAELPPLVFNAFQKAIKDLEGYRVDEIEVKESVKDGLIFEFELENDLLDKDIEFIFNANGELIAEKD